MTDCSGVDMKQPASFSVNQHMISISSPGRVEFCEPVLQNVQVCGRCFDSVDHDERFSVWKDAVVRLTGFRRRPYERAAKQHTPGFDFQLRFSTDCDSEQLVVVPVEEFPGPRRPYRFRSSVIGYNLAGTC